MELMDIKSNIQQESLLISDSKHINLQFLKMKIICQYENYQFRKREVIKGHHFNATIIKAEDKRNLISNSDILNKSKILLANIFD